MIDTAQMRTLLVLGALGLMLQADVITGNTQYQARAETAVAESLRLYGDWLGPQPLTAPASGTLPWLTADAAMEIESLVSYRVAASFWTPSAREPAIAHGLAWYLQSRAVEHLFNLRYASPGHSAESLRLFGGHVPWALPSLRSTRWSTLAPDDNPRRLPAEVNPLTIRAATAFATLERYLGWAVFQGALAALAADADTPLTSEHVQASLSAATGHDLTWFFRFAFNPERRLEYRLERFVTEPSAPGCEPACYRTTVTAARLGDAAFTGSSQPRIGNFESGTAIGLEVQFANGQSLLAEWDGRDEKRDFIFESTSPATTATLDPAGVLLLDPYALDHRLSQAPDTNVPLVKWVARWATWLQDAMLTYTMFV